MGEAVGDIVEAVFKAFATDSAVDWSVKVAIGVFATLLAIGLGKFAKWLWPRLGSLYGSIRNIERARQSVSLDGKGLWLSGSIPLKPPSGYSTKIRRSIPILVVANLKGGVGKTTTAANLVAHYAIKKGKRVLALDFDFQGSLTATAMSKEDRDHTLDVEAEGGLCKAAHLIDDKDASWLRNVAENVDDIPRARIIPTYYSLASTENRVMVEWLIGRRRYDVRYRLVDILHDNEIQERFDIIIIDAPPRLTTACVQALAASTHVLIPTVLDELSAEAVGAFAGQLRIHQSVWPQLRIIGVVGTMTDESTVKDALLRPDALKDYEALALVTIRDAMREALATATRPLRDAEVMPIDCFIPNKAELGRAAGHRIAYASQANTSPLREIREAFDRLGDEIDRRIAMSRSGVG